MRLRRLFVRVLAVLLHLAADPPHLLHAGLPFPPLLRGLAAGAGGVHVGQLYHVVLFLLLALLAALCGVGCFLHRLKRVAGLLGQPDGGDLAWSVGQVAVEAKHRLAVPGPVFAFLVQVVLPTDGGPVLVLVLSQVVLFYDRPRLCESSEAVVLLVLPLYGLVDRYQFLLLVCLAQDILIQDLLVLFQIHVAVHVGSFALAYLVLGVLPPEELAEVGVVHGGRARAARPALAGPVAGEEGLEVPLRARGAEVAPHGRVLGLERLEVRHVLVLSGRRPPQHLVQVARGAGRQQAHHLVLVDVLVLVGVLQGLHHLALLIRAGHLDCYLFGIGEEVLLALLGLWRRQDHASNPALARAADALQVLVVVVAVLGEVAVPVQVPEPVVLPPGLVLRAAASRALVPLAQAEDLGAQGLQAGRDAAQRLLVEARAPRVARLGEGLEHERCGVGVVHVGVVLRARDQLEVPDLLSLLGEPPAFPHRGGTPLCGLSL
mmetsp:Transcript_80424/g.217841  ORF Transcript_80424/g.217841 Transcript_80424/m.217841 type:complete len:489 (+) Transcript_80424:175-1641(+)